jgi:hypothetical protein
MTRSIQLTRTQAIAAEQAVAATRPWFGREAETGTYHYALDPSAELPEEIEFPIIDEAMLTIVTQAIAHLPPPIPNS